MYETTVHRFVKYFLSQHQFQRSD